MFCGRDPCINNEQIIFVGSAVVPRPSPCTTDLLDRFSDLRLNRDIPAASGADMACLMGRKVCTHQVLFFGHWTSSNLNCPRILSQSWPGFLLRTRARKTDNGTLV